MYNGYQYGMYQPNQMYNPNYYTNTYNNTYGQQNMQNQLSVPQQIPQQEETLMGKIVDGLDVVKGINADLSGRPQYFPKSDGSEIYCKRINPATGASGIQTYRIVDSSPNQVSTEEQMANILAEFKKDISVELSEIKNLVLDNLTSPKGGDR